MEQLKYDIDVPLPSRKRLHTWLDDMPVGGSKAFDRLEASGAIQAAARHKQRSRTGWSYTSAKGLDGSVRIWRTA